MKALVFALLFLSLHATADGNVKIESFSKAKKLLQNEVYADHRESLYCGASYTPNKSVNTPTGFTTEKHVTRAMWIEWEHVVPAENFGRSFREWREGHPQCVTSKGKKYKGRRCAGKIVMEYRYMQADMHNLFPAIGAVNALRSNYTFTMLPDEQVDFGSCAMKIDNRKAEPPESARGRIARTYQYMDTTYRSFKMSRKTRQLMDAWSKTYPVSDWECQRAKRIAEIQGNVNEVVSEACAG